MIFPSVVRVTDVIPSKSITLESQNLAIRVDPNKDPVICHIKRAAKRPFVNAFAPKDMEEEICAISGPAVERYPAATTSSPILGFFTVTNEKIHAKKNSCAITFLDTYGRLKVSRSNESDRYPARRAPEACQKITLTNILHLVVNEESSCTMRGMKDVIHETAEGKSSARKTMSGSMSKGFK